MRSSTATRKAKKPPAELKTLTGTITYVRFHNPQNGYSALTIETKGGDLFDEVDRVTVVGNLAAVRVGDEYELTGSWIENPKYGKQFSFQKAEVILPKERQGSISYLATLAVGVGPGKAKKIVDALGEDAIQQIIDNPNTLQQFAWLTPDQSSEISEGLLKNTKMAELSALICGEGIGIGTATRIFTEYGADSVNVVKENPYVLADDVYGIGFKVADRIGISINIAPDSPYRVESAYQYALKEAGNDGHVFLKPKDTMREIAKLLGKESMVGLENVKDAFLELEKRGVVIREGDSIYLSSMYEDEVKLAKEIMRIAEANGKYVNSEEYRDIDNIIEDIQVQDGIVYAPEQKEAIVRSFEKSLSVMTGGPGTGKSTIIKGIIQAYKRIAKNNTIMLAAPTGRAAKRMTETTDIEAMTIHRLLKFNPFEGGFQFNKDDQLPSGLLIVDEFSMCDVALSRCLFEAVPKDMVMVLVGDVDQLPSVGPGKVLEDIIESRKVITTRLKFNYRQASGSRIALEASRISEQGECRLHVDENDWKTITADEPEQALEGVKEEVRQAVTGGLGIMDFQVLAPMKKGLIGVDNLNEVIREIVNPQSSKEYKAEHKIGKDKFFRLHDKVMVIHNTYKLGVFNGDIGIIVDINSGNILVDFDGTRVMFTGEDIHVLTLAYAGTVHKSQGSEFKLIIMVVMRSHYIMLQKNLFYTGITRAREKLVLVCQESAVKRCLDNKDKKARYTLLRERLAGNKK